MKVDGKAEHRERQGDHQGRPPRRRTIFRLRCAFADIAKQLTLNFLAGGNCFLRRDAARSLLHIELAQALAVNLEVRVVGGLAALGQRPGQQRTQKKHQSDRHQSDREQGEGPHQASITRASGAGRAGGYLQLSTPRKRLEVTSENRFAPAAGRYGGRR